MSDTPLPFTSHFITTTHAPITLCIILYYNTHTHTNSNTVHTYTHVHMYSPWTHTHTHTHTQMQTHTGYTTNITHTHTRAHRHTHKIVYLYGNRLDAYIILRKPHNTQSQKSSKVNGALGKNLKVHTIKSFNYHNSNFLS